MINGPSVRAAELLAEAWTAPARLPASTVELRKEVRSFIEAQIATGTMRPQCDSWLSGWDADFSRLLASKGWVGMVVPLAYGGHSRTALERFVVVEELLAAGAPVAAHWVADRQTTASLLRFGTEEQRRRYLPQIVRGECSVALGMSEPDAGSDLASVRTRAERVAGGWRVTGTKIWTSGAHACQLLVALVRTGSSEGDRHRGLSQVLIDLPSDGVTIRPIRLIDGSHHFNEVIMEDVFVGDAAVLGQVGQGWNQVLSELAYERSGPERFLSTFPLLIETVRHLSTRPDGGESALLGRLTAELWTLRQLSVGVATALEHGIEPTVAAAIVKELGGRFETEVIEMARSLFDCEADLSGEPAAARLAEAVLHSPAFTIRGGTSEILRMVIGREVRGR